jgi:hypothetical protein
MSATPQTDEELDSGSEYQAGAACAPQAGRAIADLVAELQSAATIVEDAGHPEMAIRLRNWAICVAGVLTAHRQGDRGSEVYVG